MISLPKGSFTGNLTKIPSNSSNRALIVPSPPSAKDFTIISDSGLAFLIPLAAAYFHNLILINIKIITILRRNK